jgi:NAD(P)-dependent dehydrogenase (short-subunit alcohol dehydrogenase family)
MYQLTGKTVVVTGAGRPHGLGQAIALHFAREGCNVVVADLGRPKGAEFPAEHIGTAEQLNEVVAACQAASQAAFPGLTRRAIGLLADVRVASDCQNLMDQTVANFGRVDVLVNNAGVGHLLEPLADFKEESWDAVLDTNLKGAFLCSKYAAGYMQKQGSGCIINIAGQAAKQGLALGTAYAAAQHGLVGLTRAHAVELGRAGIRVNAVCPGLVPTQQGEWQARFWAERAGLTEADYLQAQRDRTPLGRTGQVTDVARACLFLASDQASYLTGEALNVSGGEVYH